MIVNFQVQMSMSPEGSYYLLHCLGPEVPYTILRRCANHRVMLISFPSMLYCFAACFFYIETIF